MGLTMSEGKFVGRDEIALVPTPTATASWKPVPHVEVIDAVTDVVRAHNWQILDEQYGLARDGQRMFGVIRINRTSSAEWSRCIGIRNSHDRTIAVGLAAGLTVRCCSNLMFGGSMVLKRRHTSRIELNGSVSDYLFTVNYFIEVNLTEKTFAFDSEKYIYGLTAYDYTYVELLTVYGSGLAFLFEGAYGYINVVADVADGKTVYSVSGSFNFIKDADGNPLRFSDGTLSKAGFIDAQVEGFGNLFASEFVAADGNTYHLNFYLAYNRNVQQFVYIIHSCTLAEEIFRSDDGSAVYRETFLYSSAFRFVKGENPLTGEVEYYAKGDAFYPTLSYRGEPVAVYNFEEESETRWIFYSREYAGNAYSDFRYCFEFVSDGEGNVESGVLVRYAERNIASALGDAARVVCDEETGEALEITALIVDDVYFEALSCADNGDGTFTVVTSEGTYTVTVHKNEDGEVERVSIALNND